MRVIRASHPSPLSDTFPILSSGRADAFTEARHRGQLSYAVNERTIPYGSRVTNTRPAVALSGTPSDTTLFRDAAEETADRAVLAGAPVDHSFSNRVAEITETPREKEIDAANGLRGHGGRVPTPEDFDGLLTPEGDSGDTVGSEVSNRSLVFGEDGSLGGTL